jgi:hypothetical protein
MPTPLAGGERLFDGPCSLFAPTARRPCIRLGARNEHDGHRLIVRRDGEAVRLFAIDLVAIACAPGPLNASRRASPRCRRKLQCRAEFFCVGVGHKAGNRANLFGAGAPMICIVQKRRHLLPAKSVTQSDLNQPNRLCFVAGAWPEVHSTASFFLPTRPIGATCRLRPD